MEETLMGGQLVQVHENEALNTPGEYIVVWVYDGKPWSEHIKVSDRGGVEVYEHSNDVYEICSYYNERRSVKNYYYKLDT